ncbi:hypothetical protein [Defluviitalea saccharophila]|uniref:Uncharacterized protein n=1 Tax=Defluviitalea saccharophila TaxID=879970 RepID=A0ABZ2Y2D5_9FIRM|nr:hypothetical protein [Candidatus Epulonipiscium sp.]
MMLGKEQTIVFQCATCGRFCFNNLSLFNFSGKKEEYLSCKCGKTSIRIILKDRRKVSILVPCFLCSEIHTYTFSMDKFFSDSLKTLQCPKKHMKIGFIGKDEGVRNALDHHEDLLKSILEEMGIPELCKNIEVAIESINYIHDLAELGKINCECGNTNVEMDVLTNGLKLRCTFCGNEMSLLTRNNEDLKFIQAQTIIYLQKDRTILL